MEIVIWLILFTGIGCLVGANKGRAGDCGLLGLLLGPLGIIIACFLAPKINPKSLKKCPYCAETILREATVCKHCHSSLVFKQAKFEPRPMLPPGIKVIHDGSEHGPYKRAQIVEFLHDGRLSADDVAWDNQTGDAIILEDLVKS